MKGWCNVAVLEAGLDYNRWFCKEAVDPVYLPRDNAIVENDKRCYMEALEDRATGRVSDRAVEARVKPTGGGLVL